MVTLSPSVMVISLVTRNGSFSTCFGRAYQHLVRRGQHGIGEIGGAHARQRHFDFALHEDLVRGDAELKIG